MDANGSGIMINLKHLPKLAVLRMDGFTEKKFREMCILSGCDYLQSVKGMGLITAHKLLRKHSSVNKLISTLRLNNKMKVPKDYEEKFVQAEQTFLYQIVFDPNTNKLVPLNPLPDDLNAKELHFAGHHGRWKQEHAVQLALGNLNPITGEKFGAIRAAKVISLEKEEVDNHEEQRKTLTTPANRNKAPHSVLSSSKTYEAQKNLNGSVKETRSSEKTNAPFVTPVRTKRMRSEHEDNLSEGSKLARLYSTTNDEQPVRRRLEAVVSDEGDAYETESKRPEQPRKRPKNPFRSPVIAVKRRDGQVVSRYFGLAGMETIKEEPKNHDTVTQEDDLVSETPFTSPSSTDGSLPRQSLLNFSEHRETKLQESGYCCQSIESSPTENSPNQSVHKNSTPLSSKASILAFAGTKSLSKCGISRNCENHEPPKKKIKSSQTSLEMFAFVRTSRANDFRTTKRITSPNRTVLGSISENCDCDEPNGEQVDIAKEENVKAEDFTKILDIEQESEQRNAFDEIQGQSKAEDNIKHKTRTKNIVVRTKPKTGLGRCRSVGLSNRKSKEKKTSTTVGVPLLNFFAYRGRSSQSVTF